MEEEDPLKIQTALLNECKQAGYCSFWTERKRRQQ